MTKSRVTRVEYPPRLPGMVIGTLGPVVDTKTAAEVIKCPRAAVRRLCVRGELDAHKEGCVWLITRASLLNMIGGYGHGDDQEAAQGAQAS